MLVLLLLGGGMLGLHRYAMGYRNWWIMALTLGGLSFWSLRDAILVAVDRMPMADGRPLRIP